METQAPPGSDVPCFEIALLGRFSASVAGRELALPTKKVEALLVLLARAPGRAYERETLRTLLWPDAPKQRAQASLRQALLALRTSLPPRLGSAVLLCRGAVALDPTLVRVDVSTLEQCLADSTRAALERAAALFRGSLLEGFLLGEAAFDDWLEEQRMGLQQRMLAALEQLAELQAADGSLASALQTGLHAQRLEPLQERTQRLVMRLYAQQGRRAEALQHYRRCEAMLAAELGVAPDEQTQHLFAALQRTELVGDVTSAHTLESVRPIIGRNAELALLEGALGAALRGEGRLVLLRGDAGVGKTCLLDASARAAHLRGTEVLRGRCFESEQILPFALFVDLLRGHGGMLDEVLAELPPVHSKELARLLPGPAGVATELPPALADVRHLFDAIAALVTRLARTSPRLIVLEDLHWADSMSLRLLSFLVRRLPAAARVCVMASVRAEELGSARDLRGMLRELKREQRLFELVVLPLSREHTGELVRALAAQQNDAAEALERRLLQIWNLSEGNPLVVVESLRGVRDGLCAQTEQLPVPERVRELVVDHVARLAPLAREALVTAAVIGRRFDFELLQQARRADARELACTVEELVACRLLQQTSDGLYFTHDRIREVLYRDMLPARRKLLHAAVARALEHAGRDRLDEIAGTIGYHFARAQEAQASISYLLRFAERSIRRYGLEEALAALAEAQRQSRALPAEARDVRALEIAIRRCHCLAHAGRVAEVEATLEPFRAILEELDEPALSAPFHAWNALAMGFRGHGAASIDHCVRAIAAADRCGDGRTAGLAHSLLSLEAFRSGQFQEGIVQGSKAIMILDPASADYEIAAFANLHLGSNYLSVGAWQPALQNFEQALAIGERSDSQRMQCLAHGMVGAVRLCTLELDASLAACERAIVLAPDPHSAWLTHLLVVRAFSFVAAERGDSHLLSRDTFANSLKVLELSLSMTGGPDMRGFVGRATVVLAEAYLVRGDAARARATVQGAFAPLAELGDAMGSAVAHRVLAKSELALGLVDEASRHIGEALGRFALLGAQLEVALTRLTGCSVARARADHAQLERELAAARQQFSALELPRWVERVTQHAAPRAPQ